MNRMDNDARRRLWQALLLAAALDTAAEGVWAALRPGDLFALLNYPPSDDGLFLCRLLGLLYLAQSVFLLLAAWRPDFAGLTLGPLFGRLLTCGVWLWLTGLGRMPAAGVVLIGLLVHDAVWPPLYAVYLTTNRAKHSACVNGEASPAPAFPAAPPPPPA